MDELLYTQEDIDEWIRTCEELQEKIKEQEEIIKELSEYKKLEEQGLIVRLPCKVGDTCYFVTKVAEEYELLCGQVISICIDNGGIWFYCYYSVGMSYWHNSENKDLFFTKAEAEKKLEELKEKKDD